MRKIRKNEDEIPASQSGKILVDGSDDAEKRNDGDEDEAGEEGQRRKASHMASDHWSKALLSLDQVMKMTLIACNTSLRFVIEILAFYKNDHG